jgi:hypothetical protein
MSETTRILPESGDIRLACDYQRDYNSTEELCGEGWYQTSAGDTVLVLKVKEKYRVFCWHYVDPREFWKQLLTKPQLQRS